MYDRMVVGGAMPVGEVLQLEAIDPLKAPYFLTRREIGIFNVGGPGGVKAGDAVLKWIIRRPFIWVRAIVKLLLRARMQPIRLNSILIR